MKKKKKIHKIKIEFYFKKKINNKNSNKKDKVNSEICSAYLG